MIVELSHFALMLATVLAFAQAALSMSRPAAAPGTAVTLSLSTALLILMGFAGLIHAFVVSDFSVELVREHSHVDKPFLYKIAGTWGNHEGSMLLWILVAALFGAALSWRGFQALTGRNDAAPSPQAPGNTASALHARAGGVQAGVVGVFLVYLLGASNPFSRLDPAAWSGSGLNPVLQDPALAAHPPVLYAGYVGLSAVFALAVAGLLQGRLDRGWAAACRPWALWAWAFLTAGIALGSFWAYYELGWGGWWFWDPVENASLLPWLVAGALIHCLAAGAQRGRFLGWAAGLAILGFTMSLFGAFLVRSGLLTSVHAFALDPTRGLILLGMAAGLSGGALALFVWRGGKSERGGTPDLISRDGTLMANNWALMTLLGIVLTGTAYPLVLEALGGERITVGPPFFNMATIPIAVIAALILPFGPLLGRRAARLAQALSASAIAALLTAGVCAVVFAGRGPEGFAFAGAAGFAVWLMAGAAVDVWQQTRSRLTRRGIGRVLGHGGLAVMVLGMAAASLLSSRIESWVPVGGAVEWGGERAQLQSITTQRGPNFIAERAALSLQDGRILQPERRFYPVSGQMTTEVALAGTGLSHHYAVLGEGRDFDGTTRRRITVQHQPLVRLIWVGAGLLVLGGVLAALPRRSQPRQESEPA